MYEELKSQIVENLPMVLFVVDGEFRVRYLNRSFSEMFHCGKAETTEVGRLIGCRTLVSGGHCTEMPECTLCRLRQALYDCIAKGRQVYKKLIEKKVVLEGLPHTLSLKLTISPLGEDGYICVVDDVTEIIELSEGEKRLNRQLLTDLKKAKHIQRDLLPPKGDAAGVTIDYLYRQLNGVGGDFFDVFRIDATHTGMYIADVAGHGVGGGMLTVFLKENYDRAALSPAQALRELYERFNRFRFAENSYITVFAAVLDTSRRTVAYSNAGHGVPGLLEHGGGVRELTLKGAPISNWFHNASYFEVTEAYESGDRLMLTTDGIVDMKQGSVEFGLGPLKDCLAKEQPFTEVLPDLIRRADNFTGGGGDDIAVLAALLP